MITEKFKSESLGKVILPGKGNPKSRILIVGSHPSANDLKMGEIYSMQKPRDDKPFVFNQAVELHQALETAGIGFDQVYITLMCKHGIGSKPKPKKEDIAGCFDFLEEEIKEIRPDLIIALGAEAFKRVMKKSMKSADFLGEIIDCPYGRVLCNHSPGTVSMDPRLRNEFTEIFQLAKDYVLDDQNYTPIEYHVIDDVETAKQLISTIIENEWFEVGYDLEWRGKKWFDDEVVYTVQISVQDDIAFIFDISKDGVIENKELLDTLKPLFEHPRTKRMGWNIRADEIRLKHRGFNLLDEGLYWDGMKGMAFFDSRWSKGLEQGIKKFTNYEPYYVELSLLLKKHKIKKEDMSLLRILEPEAFFRYCAGDAVAHRTACLNQIAFFPKHHWKYFTEVYMPLSHYLCDMQWKGLFFDKPVADDIRTKYVVKFEELSEKLQKLVEPYFDQLNLKPINKKPRKQKGGQEVEYTPIFKFNPNSPSQKKKLLFEILRLEPAYYTKAGKSPKPRSWYDRQSEITQRMYSPSTNGKSLSTMLFQLKQDGADYLNSMLPLEFKHYQLQVIETLLNLGRVNVFANKFLSIKGVELDEEDEEVFEDETDLEEEEPLKQSYYAAACSDSVIRADFFECLKNFRSSSRINVQNPASKVLAHMPEIFVPGYSKLNKDKQKEVDHLIPKNIRNIFGVPDKNKWLYSAADVGSADLGIMAFISRDDLFIDQIREGNFHLNRMRSYFKDNTLTKENIDKYTQAKSLTFNANYISELSAAAPAIQADIFASSGTLLSIEEIQYALNTWNEFPTYMAWREVCKQEAAEQFQITNPRGMVYTFAETNDPAIKAGYLNESLAFPVASELALFVYDCCVSLKRQFVKDKVWMKYVFPINIVHDDIQHLVSKELCKDNYFQEVMRNYMTKEVKIATGDNVGMELCLSDCWKGKQKFFNKSTVWVDNNWEWES